MLENIVRFPKFILKNGKFLDAHFENFSVHGVIFAHVNCVFIFRSRFSLLYLLQF